ncbi:hypothetical protein EYF80_066053 [Liparis tanakae]|uniref:Uncharacterized protein n=1 Tax=Liparis tanakae TaxID=230148 RepID=A0A4Z2E4T5_9TELE|nr:hypothetical protein EYF80_066053 [Liparis tanakae]
MAAGSLGFLLQVRGLGEAPPTFCCRNVAPPSTGSSLVLLGDPEGPPKAIGIHPRGNGNVGIRDARRGGTAATASSVIRREPVALAETRTLDFSGGFNAAATQPPLAALIDSN